MIGSPRSFRAATAASNSARVTPRLLATSSYGGFPSRRPMIRTPSASPSGHATAGERASDSGSNRTGAARSETKKPFTFSAGQVAHQSTTPTTRPFAEARFQIAGTRRERPEIGRRVPVFGSSSWKSVTPWSTGVRPVAIVVQMSGDAIGWYVFRFQVRPFAISAFRCGSAPAFRRGSRNFQSAPSQPTRTTRALFGAGAAGFPAGAESAGSAAARRAAAKRRAVVISGILRGLPFRARSRPDRRRDAPRGRGRRARRGRRPCSAGCGRA